MGVMLDKEGKFHVYYTSGGCPVQRFVTLSHEQTNQYIHLTPLQFLQLLEWGEGQRPVLREMVEAEGEKDIEDEFPGLIEFLNGNGSLPLPLIPEGQDIYWRGKRVSPEQMSKAINRAQEGKQ